MERKSIREQQREKIGEQQGRKEIRIEDVMRESGGEREKQKKKKEKREM